MGSDEACEALRQGGPTGVRSGPVPVSVCFHNTTGGVGAPKPTLSFHDSPGLICAGSSRRGGRLGAANGKGTDSRPGQARLELGVSPPRGSGGRGLIPLKPRVTSHAGWPARGPPLSIGGQVSLGTWLTAHVGGLNLQPLQPQGPVNPIVSPDSGLTQHPVNKDALLSGVSQGLRASSRSWAGQSLVGPVGCGQPRAAELTLYCRGGGVCGQMEGAGPPDGSPALAGRPAFPPRFVLTLGARCRCAPSSAEPRSRTSPGACPPSVPEDRTAVTLHGAPTRAQRP